MDKKEVHKPERYDKGWGHEDWVVNFDKYCGKILHFNKNKKFSIHYHKIKEETFHLVSGLLDVMLADNSEAFEKGEIEKFIMKPGETIHLWPGRVHQIKALEDSDLIEFSTQHFEDDSYRIEKGD